MSKACARVCIEDQIIFLHFHFDVKMTHEAFIDTKSTYSSNHLSFLDLFSYWTKYKEQTYA